MAAMAECQVCWLASWDCPLIRSGAKRPAWAIWDPRPCRSPGLPITRNSLARRSGQPLVLALPGERYSVGRDADLEWTCSWTPQQVLQADANEHAKKRGP